MLVNMQMFCKFYVQGQVLRLLSSVTSMEPSQQSRWVNVPHGSTASKDPRSPLWQYVEILGKNLGGGSYR